MIMEDVAKHLNEEVNKWVQSQDLAQEKY
jgi:hypothetical protein